MNRKPGLALHWKILIGMAAGLLVGGLFATLDRFAVFYPVLENPGDEEELAEKVWLGVSWAAVVVDWIKPFGSLFINALKTIAVPLIVASLIKGVSDLKDLSTLSSMGGRTIGLYLCTTAVAVTVGLMVGKVVNPARFIDAETRDSLVAQSEGDASQKMKIAADQKAKGPLQPLVDLVPDNLFAAATDNKRMLQVIVFVLFFSVGLLLVPVEDSAPVKAFFDGLNEIVLKLIDLIMLVAPFGVFALMAALVAETPSWGVFASLLVYSLCVVAGLAVLIFGFYPLLVVTFTRCGYLEFFRGISPAQLLGFSTSSSAATLPVTMERVEQHLGVDEEVASFVLPIGATVNMDGTSLYQAVAAVFIAQAYGVEVGFGEMTTIALTAMLASIGTAAVPSAGIVMLVIVLGAIDAPEEGIALIFAVDRVLDMCRTIANVTSDASVSMLVAKGVGKLHEPGEREGGGASPEAAPKADAVE